MAFVCSSGNLVETQFADGAVIIFNSHIG